MARAVWRDAVIAESDRYEQVEGNIYFPPDAVNRQYLDESTRRSRCPWKGEAHYFHVTVNGKTNKDAAWCYADPSPAASHIKDHIAFWKGMRVKR